MSLNSIRFRFIIVCVIAFFVLGVGVWLMIGAVSSTSETFTELPQPSSEERPLVEEGELALRTKDGYLVVTDITQYPLETYTGEVFVLKEERLYTIVYFASAEQFMISLLNRERSLEAEQTAVRILADLLGVNDNDLCALNVVVEVPFHVDYERSGEYGLRQCTNAVQLP